VWKLLIDAGYDVNADEKLGTALYYGLYMDTNQFSEIYNPIDMDMRDQIIYDKQLITLLRNSNISMRELEIAGVAMLRCIYNEDYNYAIIKAAPCDPNILGLISDFLLQVDSVHVCVVYNESVGGYKLSVRSCVKEVRASELALYLTDKIGTGGGHYEKAGGFINKALYRQYYPTVHSEGYIGQRLNKYFSEIQIIYANEYDIDVTDMKKYAKRRIPVGFVRTEDIWPVGTPFTIRTLEGDLDVVSDSEVYIIIGLRGEIHLIKKEAFEKRYEILTKHYVIEAEYAPIAKNKKDGTAKELMDYAGTCKAIGENLIYAQKLETDIKVFGMWDEQKYVLGRKGDYLAVNMEDLHDIYIVGSEVFSMTYVEVR
jgi:phosphoglycolate phosphatase